MSKPSTPCLSVLQHADDWLWLLHGIVTGDAARGPVFAVETVLQVEFGLSDQVISSHQIPVIDWDGERGIHGERGLNVKAPKLKTFMLLRMEWDLSKVSVCENMCKTFNTFKERTSREIIYYRLRSTYYMHALSLYPPVRGLVRRMSSLWGALTNEQVCCCQSGGACSEAWDSWGGGEACTL